MEGLTQQQAELLDFIRRYGAEKGASPSYDEMTVGAGIPSKGSIHRLLKALEERGAITTSMDGRYRSITVTDHIPCLSALRAMSAEGLDDLRRRVEAVSFERTRAAGFLRLETIRGPGLEHVSAPLNRALGSLKLEGSK